MKVKTILRGGVILSFKRTLHVWGSPTTTRTSHPCVSQIPITLPNLFLQVCKI